MCLWSGLTDSMTRKSLSVLLTFPETQYKDYWRVGSMTPAAHALLLGLPHRHGPRGPILPCRSFDRNLYAAVFYRDSELDLSNCEVAFERGGGGRRHGRCARRHSRYRQSVVSDVIEFG